MPIEENIVIRRAKEEAKELLHQYQNNNLAAVRLVCKYFPDQKLGPARAHEIVARKYGFKSWIGMRAIILGNNKKEDR